jgi:hypothetical protein
MSYTLAQLSDRFHEEFDRAKGEFSAIVFNIWKILGEELGYQVKPSTVEKEYLVDLCWIYDAPDKRWMELALESELSKYAIKGIFEDFNKLLDIKAYTKVGIFYPSMFRKQDVLKAIANAISSQEIKYPKEQYLIIFIIDYKKQRKPSNMVEITSYQINLNGEITKLRESNVRAEL